MTIFGPLNGLTAMHVQSICNTFNIPHIETRRDFHSQTNNFSINLYPSPRLLTRAYIDIIKSWNWKSFAIVCEDNDGKCEEIIF